MTIATLARHIAHRRLRFAIYNNYPASLGTKIFEDDLKALAEAVTREILSSLKRMNSEEREELVRQIKAAPAPAEKTVRHDAQ